MYMSDIFSGIINLRERTQCTLDIQNLNVTTSEGIFNAMVCHAFLLVVFTVFVLEHT